MEDRIIKQVSDVKEEKRLIPTFDRILVKEDDSSDSSYRSSSGIYLSSKLSEKS